MLCHLQALRKLDALLEQPPGPLPDGKAATLLAAARCKYIAEGNWGSRRYLDVSLLDGWDERSIAGS